MRQGGRLILRDTAFGGSALRAGAGGGGGAASGSAEGSDLFLHTGVTAQVDITAGTNFINAGTIGGAGSLSKSGLGTLTLAAANTYSGGTAITAGLINFNSANNFGSGTITLNGGGLQWAAGTAIDISPRLAPFGASGATFDTNGNNVTLGSTLAGVGGLSKIGAGTLTLSGTGTYTGATAVNAGTLVVDGVCGSTAVTVANGARLGGSGTVGAVDNSGTIAPGSSTGTLTMAGTLQLNSSSAYEVDVEPAGASDRLAVQGSAQLAGTVVVKPAAGSYAKRTRYTILNASGGLGGTQFQSLSVTNPGLSAELTYDPDAVFLTLTDSSIRQFTGIVVNQNQQALASVLDALDGSGNVPVSLQPALDRLRGLSADLQQAALEELAPEEHATEASTVVASSNQVQRTLASEIHAHQGGTAPPSHPVGAVGPAGRAMVSVAAASMTVPVSLQRASKADDEVWALGFGVGGDVDPVAGAAKARFHGGGVALGRGWRVRDELTLGGLAGYSETRVNTGVNGSRTDVETPQCGVYAIWARDRWYADALVTRTFSNHEGRRVITTPGLAGVASGKRDGHATVAFVEAGRSYPSGRVTLVPHSTLQVGRFAEDAFTETGAGALNLNVAATAVDSFQTGLGLRVEQARPHGPSPRVTLRWAHELGEIKRAVDASFVGTAQSFRVTGRPASRDALQIQAGATGRLHHGPELEVAYVGEEGSGQSTRGGFARAVWRW